MLILPQAHDYKVLVPLARSGWRTPSRAQPKDMFGNEDYLTYRLDGMGRTGAVRWRGWFRDREDLDAFLWALATGWLAREPALWRLPDPWWHPGEGQGLIYQAAGQDFLTSTPGSLLTYTSRGDYSNVKNAVEMLGGGGMGANNSANHAGSQGGGYSSKGQSTNLGANYTFATPGVTTAQYQVSKGGLNGINEAGQGWFGAATFGAAPISIDTAGHGGEGGANRDGGNQNVAGTSAGTLIYNGGKGGDIRTGFGTTGNGAGGGGAAGPHGAGNAGGDLSTSFASNVTSSGGAGDAGFGGAAGIAPGGNAAAGAEWGVGHGAGGGSAGQTGGNCGNGGNYGGGLGGGSGPVQAPQGLIVVTYLARRFGFVVPNLVF